MTGDDEDDDPQSFEDCISDEECDAFFNRQIAAANRADPALYECPNCGERVLSAYQRSQGYQCDSCADKAESGVY